MKKSLRICLKNQLVICTLPDLLDEEEKDLDTEINDGEETIDYTKIKNEKVY